MPTKLLILFVLTVIAFGLTGCGRLSTEKGMDDCVYEAAKTTANESQRADIVRACMRAKGYETATDEAGCFSAVYFVRCWQRTWRIVLP